MIEKYIEFAIENGFEDMGNFKVEQYRCTGVTRNMIGKFIKYNVEKEIEWGNPGSNMSGIENIQINEYVDIINIITSKPFIEAVARGVCRKPRNAQMRLVCQADKMVDVITKKQAIAIRDDKLSEFIENLLPKE